MEAVGETCPCRACTEGQPRPACRQGVDGKRKEREEKRRRAVSQPSALARRRIPHFFYLSVAEMTDAPPMWVGPGPWADTSVAAPDPLLKLSNEQREKFREFRALLTGLTPADAQFCDDACLCRYLRARDFDVKKSHKMLCSTLTWRKEFRPQHISPDDVEEEAVTGKLYRNGFDKMGRPVIYMRSGRENTKTYDRQVRHLVYHVERAIASARPGVEQLVLFIDYTGFSMSNSPPMSISKQILNILMDHYPERLGMAIMVQQPWYFSVFWAAISPFLNSVTKAKIHMYKGDAEKLLAKLLDYISPDAIEKQFGGSNAFEYVHDQYWPTERLVWQKVKPALHAETDADADADVESANVQI